MTDLEVGETLGWLGAAMLRRESVEGCLLRARKGMGYHIIPGFGAARVRFGPFIVAHSNISRIRTESTLIVFGSPEDCWCLLGLFRSLLFTTFGDIYDIFCVAVELCAFNWWNLRASLNRFPLPFFMFWFVSCARVVESKRAKTIASALSDTFDAASIKISFKKQHRRTLHRQRRRVSTGAACNISLAPYEWEQKRK